MSDVSTAADVADAGAVAPPDAPIDLDQALVSLNRRREAAAKATDTAPEQPPAVERPRYPDGKFAPTESAPQEHDAGPDDQPPSDQEAEATDPAEELPPVDPPRSWTKEDKEWFAQLPRETQSRITEREQSRETDFRRQQNEAAQAKQSAEAERQKAEQERQRYEQAVTEALQIASQQMQGEFADIKSHQDMMRLAEEDPFRFAKFQAHQTHLQALANQARQVQQQREQEAKSQFEKWSAEQDDVFQKEAKEYADEKTASKAREDTIAYLTEVRGIPKDQLGSLWSNPLFRAAPMQLIIRDAVRWHRAQKSAVDVATKKLPPPSSQRPGAARPSAKAADVKALQDRFNNNPSTENAVALRQAKRAAGLS